MVSASSWFSAPRAPRIAIWQIFWVLMCMMSFTSLSAFFLRWLAPSHITDSGSIDICLSKSMRNLVRSSAMARKRSPLTCVMELLFISTL